MLTVTRPTDNTTVITITDKLNTPEQLDEVMATVIASSDFTGIGQIKPHYKTVDGNKTTDVEGFFINVQKRLPGVHAATFDGETFYTKNANIKIDLFKIQASPYAVAGDATEKVEAATFDVTSVKAKLDAIKAAAAAKVAAATTV